MLIHCLFTFVVILIFVLLFCYHFLFLFFFFNDTATTEIYTLSLHDALPISLVKIGRIFHTFSISAVNRKGEKIRPFPLDRKSTRLNSSHGYISYAVFCLKKKKKKYNKY